MSASPIRPIPETIAGLPRISLRSLPAGGAVLRDPRLTPADLLLEADELLLLVHGFNNSEGVAFASYRDFMTNIGPAWAAQSAGVFWPGDGRTEDMLARAGWRSVLLSAASYPYQPQRAVEAAGYLADIVSRACVFRAKVAARRGRRSAELVINVVGHSMGCRLALELLRLLRSALTAGARLRVRHVALMAAAVPAYHVAKRGELEQALTTAELTTVYWSRRDQVLRFLFPLGQALERPFPRGWWPQQRRALGRVGATGSARLRSVEVALGHSGYWPDREVAERIRNDLEARADGEKVRHLSSRLAVVRTVRLRPLPRRRA
jgi:pimeloyl-ACP methyl ester carboxylesterase